MTAHDASRADLARLTARRRGLLLASVAMLAVIIVLVVIAANGLSNVGFIALGFGVLLVAALKVRRDLREIERVAQRSDGRMVSLRTREVKVLGGPAFRQIYLQVYEDATGPLVEIPIGAPLSGIASKQRAAGIADDTPAIVKGLIQAGQWLVVVLNDELILPSGPCRDPRAGRSLD